jgi:hypothetical protein
LKPGAVGGHQRVGEIVQKEPKRAGSDHNERSSVRVCEGWGETNVSEFDKRMKGSGLPFLYRV